MIVLYIILGFIGYILVASIIGILYTNMFDAPDILFAAVLWPITFPFVFVYIIMMLLAALVKWTTIKMEKLYKKIRNQSKKKKDEIDRQP